MLNHELDRLDETQLIQWNSKASFLAGKSGSACCLTFVSISRIVSILIHGFMQSEDFFFTFLRQICLERIGV
jgi:hypothetical protein